MPIEITGFLILSLIIVLVAVVFASQGIKVVPQQTAWVVERLGKGQISCGTQVPGLNFIILSLIVRLIVTRQRNSAGYAESGPPYYARQHTAPWTRCFLSGYRSTAGEPGTSNYIIAVTQLAQTTLRSVVRARWELDKTLRNET